MGLCNSPDIFQENMFNLFRDLQLVREYIADPLIITNGTFEEHLKQVNLVLSRLYKAVLKVNAIKSLLCKSEVNYLGHLIITNSIKPQPKKVGTIHNMELPKTRKQLSSFLGPVNFHYYIYRCRCDRWNWERGSGGGKLFHLWQKDASFLYWK